MNTAQHDYDTLRIRLSLWAAIQFDFLVNVIVREFNFITGHYSIVKKNHFLWIVTSWRRTCGESRDWFTLSNWLILSGNVDATFYFEERYVWKVASPTRYDLWELVEREAFMDITHEPTPSWLKLPTDNWRSWVVALGMYKRKCLIIRNYSHKAKWYAILACL